MKIRWPTLIASALALACMTSASADDGEKTLKEMTGGNTDNQLTVLPEAIGHNVADAEHAFIDMMKFYVPSQAASGLIGPVDYNNVDLLDVEDLGFAKPLVSVFIYGPTVPVDDTAFAHSFMDTFAGISLDDGVTWKTTNLSQTADMSSFTLGVDGQSGGHDDDDELPADHNQRENDKGEFAFHAPGMDYPYTNGCTDCHGATLEGGHHREPSCYSCHGPEWEEQAPDGITVIYIEEATFKDKKNKKGKKGKSGELEVEGEVEGLDENATVTLINGVTEAVLATEEIDEDGEFEFEIRPDGLPPCTIAVIADGEKSHTVPVLDHKTDEPLENCEGEPVDLTIYPGGAYNVFHATAGNKVLVAWPSRFCQQGQPAYSFAYDADPEEDPADPNVIKRNAIAEYLNIDVNYDLYLTDLFEVAGSQGSIDFADEGYPQAGEVPFGCVWTARGVLLPGDDPRTGELESSHMVWTKPERLTSGRRDPNRIEVNGVQGAGFVITWQEDPDGLRPGQGEGPGEGWSGAVAHDKTDVWYSFIPWEHFDTVEIEDTTGDGVPDPINIADHDLLLSGRPQVYVPMAMPMRLTNNDKCNADYFDPGITDATDAKYFSYCNYEVAADYGLQNFCQDTVEVPQGQDGSVGFICVNDDGLPNIANTASTRPRTSLQGYDSDGDLAIDSAWVIVAAEESKGLGRYAFLPGGTPCEDVKPDEPAYDPDCGADIGKNQWYFSFDMGEPRTLDTAFHPNGLVQNLVKQGNLLNQPESDYRTGEFYPVLNTSLMWDFGTYNYDLYNTEIARRSSLLVQPISKALTSMSGILATPSWKQGVMRQGGPADTMLRRIVMPAGYVDGIDNNPYAFTNMACEAVGDSGGWILTNNENPYYPDGICLAPATNLSGVVPDTCRDDDTGVETACPTVTFGASTFGVGDTNPILQGYLQGEGNKTRVLTWHQCPSDGAALDTSELEGGYFDCDTDSRTDPFVNLKDQSWYNPLDVSKGHRGFIDGDFVMFLYAWSPNWRLNAKGNDRYDLYVRRSFDGGQTWQTTPGTFTASDNQSYTGDGTVTCETYRSSDTGTSGALEPHVCYDYPAGGNEQARNITQHSRMRVTTLDPRYAPTSTTIADGCLDGLGAIDTSAWACDDGSAYDSDLRNPSRYFMVYETGDNSTVAEGEAEPEDLFYSRAENFGDNYVVWTETDTGFDADPTSVCYPTVAYEDAKVAGTVVENSGFCNEFNRMNAGGDTHSSEANLEANPDGSKLYGVWGQWVFDDLGEDVIDSEANARRIWWLDEWRSADATNTWTLPGTNQPE